MSLQNEQARFTVRKANSDSNKTGGKTAGDKDEGK